MPGHPLVSRCRYAWAPPYPPPNISPTLDMVSRGTGSRQALSPNQYTRVRVANLLAKFLAPSPPTGEHQARGALYKRARGLQEARHCVLCCSVTIHPACVRRTVGLLRRSFSWAPSAVLASGCEERRAGHPPSHAVPRQVSDGAGGEGSSTSSSTDEGTGKPLYSDASSRRVKAKYFRRYAVGMSPS